MSHRRWLRLVPPGLAVLGALVLCGLTLARLWQADEIRLPAPAEASAPSHAEQSGVQRDRRPAFDVLAAVMDGDPFRPDRRTPLGGEPSADTGPVAPTGPLVLVGTAVGAGNSGNGGFAMCQLAGAPAKVVRVGETIGPYTLLAVAQARATFRDAGGESFELLVARTGGTGSGS